MSIIEQAYQDGRAYRQANLSFVLAGEVLERQAMKEFAATSLPGYCWRVYRDWWMEGYQSMLREEEVL